MAEKRDYSYKVENNNRQSRNVHQKSSSTYETNFMQEQLLSTYVTNSIHNNQTRISTTRDNNSINTYVQNNLRSCTTNAYKKLYDSYKKLYGRFLDLLL